MTPFSPAALVVMLLTFYPDVSAATLVRARLERPEYFAGGVLGGSHGDKMTLPDGSGWDLIFDVENATGQRHWQAIQPRPSSDAGDDLYPLEPGPLTPIDLAQWPTPTPQPVFEPLVAAALGEIAGADDVLHTAHGTITEHASTAPLEAAYAATVPPADAARVAQLGALAATVPADVLAAIAGNDYAIDDAEGDLNEEPPPDLPPVGDLPPAPGDTGIDTRQP